MARVTVLTASSTIIAGPGIAQSVLIRRRDTANSIFLEMGTVGRGSDGAITEPIATLTSGFEWLGSDTPLSVDVPQGAMLVGIAATADQIIDVLLDHH